MDENTKVLITELKREQKNDSYKLTKEQWKEIEPEAEKYKDYFFEDAVVNMKCYLKANYYYESKEAKKRRLFIESLKNGK